MGRNKYLQFGILWAVVGLAVLVVDHVVGLEWFSVRVAGVPVSLGWLVLVLAGLNLHLHRAVQAQLRLTPAEIVEYADRLEAAMPDIIAMVGRKVRAGEIADRLLERHAIPRLVTLKFLIALGDARKGRSPDSGLRRAAARDLDARGPLD